MAFNLTTRLNRAAKHLAPLGPRRFVRALRHHHARTRAIALAPRLDGLRAWLHAILATMRTQTNARRIGLPMLLHKPSSVRALALRQAGGTRRRVNRPRRLSTSAGWFAFGAR